MTIHSDWARLLKEECPAAFLTDTPRQAFGVGVIDGHLQLMCLHNKLPTWELFVKYLFLRPIIKLFDAGCPRVVLCFDSYDNVPAYKNMTQLKRAKGHKVCVFDASQKLPPNIPDDPMLYLMNRDFKKKVIDLVCEKIPKMIELKSGQELIIDYKRVVQYSFEDKEKSLIPIMIPDLEPMGESDVKFARYVDRYGNALVHAIDGDYLAIALLYYSVHGLTSNNKIFIYRQFSSLAKAGQQTNKPSKRLKINGANFDGGRAEEEGEDDDDDQVVGVKSKRKIFKKKEPIAKGWVDMQLLFTTISQSVWKGSSVRLLNAHTQEPFTDGDAVHAVVLLMLCAGTDFSRSFPMLGPKTIWDNLPKLRNSLLQAAPWNVEVNDSLILDGVISKLYKIVYIKHVPANCMSLAEVLYRLKKSSLSTTTKSRLPTEDQAKATIQNLKWVLRYWEMHNGSVETPMDGSNGFMLCPKSRQVIFTDKVQV